MSSLGRIAKRFLPGDIQGWHGNAWARDGRMTLKLLLLRLASLQRSNAMLRHDAASWLSHTLKIEACTCATYGPRVVNAFFSSKATGQTASLVVLAALSSSPGRGSWKRSSRLILGVLGHNTALGPCYCTTLGPYGTLTGGQSHEGALFEWSAKTIESDRSRLKWTTVRVIYAVLLYTPVERILGSISL
jgi:hypothetical protein